MAALDHIRNKCMCGQHKCAGRDAVRTVQILNRRFHNRIIQRHIHRIVEQNIHLAKCCIGFFFQSGDVIGIGNIGLHKDGRALAVICIDLIRNGLAALCAAADDHYFAACPGDGLCESLTNVAGRSGDDGNFTLQTAFFQTCIGNIKHLFPP